MNSGRPSLSPGNILGAIKIIGKKAISDEGGGAEKFGMDFTC